MSVEKAVDGSKGNFQSPDGILTGAQRERIQVGVVGTGFSQGPELIRLINFLQTKFVNLSHIELIIPSATLQGLVQALAKTSPGISLRTHVFETLLDSRDGGGTFFSHPEFHLRPVLSQRYRAWWGRDWSGRPIANMPHIGTDNADALFDPLRQIRTLNARLEKSHQTNLAQVLARHLSLAPVKG